LKRWQRHAQLFQGEAERLPFRDAVFDCVFHVGGINFFSDKERAITEMIRAAKPGTKLVIVDETEKVVSQQYQKHPGCDVTLQAETTRCPAPSAWCLPGWATYGRSTLRMTNSIV